MKIAKCIGFGASLDELALIESITDRTIPMAQRAKVETDRDYWLLLIGRAHYHCPLDLEALYTAPDREFAADVFGLRNYFEGKSGQFYTEWRPTCAKPQKQDSSC